MNNQPEDDQQKKNMHAGIQNLIQHACMHAGIQNLIQHACMHAGIQNLIQHACMHVSSHESINPCMNLLLIHACYICECKNI